MNKNVDSSIANKISRRHFGEMVSYFLIINIVLLLFFAAAVFSMGEKYTGNLIADGEYAQLSDSKPLLFSKRIIFEQDKGDFLSSVIIYRVWKPYENGFAAYDYDFSDFAMLSAKLFIGLIILELLLLLTGMGKSRRAIRHALRPLADLTETAQNINRLAGKLDKIDADGLETRISIESSQKELSGLAEAINGMLDRINESYSSQARFVSDASHELRTPISVIQGYANMLDRWGKNDEKALQESIDAIKSESRNMKDLIEQLLFLARGDSDTMRLSIEKLNLSEIVSEVVHETELISPV
jgi:signal transduction histidine kinase